MSKGFPPNALEREYTVDFATTVVFTAGIVQGQRRAKLHTAMRRLSSSRLCHLALIRGLDYQNQDNLPSLLTEDLMPLHLLQHNATQAGLRQHIIQAFCQFDTLSLQDLYTGMDHQKQEAEALSLKQLRYAVVSEFLQASKP